MSRDKALDGVHFVDRQGNSWVKLSEYERLTAENTRYEILVSELYQVCGSLLCDAGALDSDEGQMLMDELYTPTGQSLLPWPAFKTDTKGQSDE